MKLQHAGTEREVSCEELPSSLPSSGEFLLTGDPLEIEKCWRLALWRLRGKKYVLSEDLEPGKVRGWVISRVERPPKAKKTRAKVQKRRRSKRSRDKERKKRAGTRKKTRGARQRSRG